MKKLKDKCVEILENHAKIITFICPFVIAWVVFFNINWIIKFILLIIFIPLYGMSRYVEGYKFRESLEEIQYLK